MGTPLSTPFLIQPKIVADGLISGNMCSGMPKNLEKPLKNILKNQS